MSEYKAALKIVGVYVAVILGAGYASGQELSTFFIRFGIWGFAGLLAAGVVFALFCTAVLSLCRRHRVADYSAFLEAMLGRRAGFIMECAVAVFLFTLFAAMLAAGGATCRQAFNVPADVGALVLAACCFLTFLFDLKGLVDVSAVLAPIMVLGGVFVALYALLFGHVAAFAPVLYEKSWLMAALTYVAYNLVTVTPVLVALSGFAKTPRAAAMAGVLSGVALTVLSACLGLLLFFGDKAALALEIPILAMLAREHFLIRGVYLFVLAAAIYTTAVGNGFAFLEMAGRNMRGRKIALKAGITLLAVLAAKIGFSTFVSVVYPVFGLFGFIQIAAVLILFAKSRKKVYHG